MKLVIISEPFKQRGIDVIGEINPNSSLQHKYILIATDHFTIWVEAIPLRKVNEDAIMDFLQDHIMTKFGVPISLVFFIMLHIFHLLNLLHLQMKKELSYIILLTTIHKEMV